MNIMDKIAQCPKCNKELDYSFYNKCECGCNFYIDITEDGYVKTIVDESLVDYQKVVEQLNDMIQNKDWEFVFHEVVFPNGIVKIIFLYDRGAFDNKYRVYHSELNDNVNSDRELLECCIESLHEVYKEIKSVMSSVLESGYVMLSEMGE